MSQLRFAVIGAGCGGQSLAAVLAGQGCRVALMDRDRAVVQALRERGRITLTGKLRLEAAPALITEDAEEAIAGADVILVATTADGHEEAARSIAKAIAPGQLVLLNPGMFCGSLAFRTALARYGCPHPILVAETADLIYACRRAGGVGEVFHSGLKKSMALAAVPAGEAERVTELLKPYFPILTPAKDILHTSLTNIGPVLHCVPMLMNVNRLDAGEGFDYYMEGITPSIARMAEAVDAERVALAKALGVEAVSAAQSVKSAYGLTGDTLYEVIQANEAYRGIRSPTSLAHRFCAEDTFGSLVGFATLGRELGVPVPAMEAVVRCISMAAGIDYFQTGRTAEKVGLKGRTAAEITALIR